MARRFLAPVCAALVLIFSTCALSDAQQPGFSQIEIHDPFSSRYVSMTPVGSGWDGLAGVGRFGTIGTTYAFTTGAFAPGLVAGYGTFGPLVGPYFGGPFVANPYWGGPYFGGVVFAPLVLPAEGMFGPRAMQRFLGVADPPVQVMAQPVAAARQPAPPAAGGFGVLGADAGANKAPGKARATNADARARSQRFIVLGDGYFANQKYSDAYQRYKLALQAAPDMADGFLRQGFALVALGRYEAAARSFKRGMTLAPDWPAADFRLDQLYGDAGIAKAAHIEALRQEALRAPSSDVLFLVGLMLYCDGQPDKAFAPLQRALELSGGDDAHIRTLLRRVDPAGKAPAPEQPLAQRVGAPRAATTTSPARPLARGVPVPTAAPTASPIAPFSKLPATRADEAPQARTAARQSKASPSVLPYGMRRVSVTAGEGKDL